MRTGVVLPTLELGSDVEELRRYLNAIEQAGYSHILLYDHVVGPDLNVHTDLSNRIIDHDSTFHEPLITAGFIAALTSLELFTGVLILPQRQTALVAKQAAQVDIFSKGRLRLGVGVGWNPVEYEALGNDFATRGRRIDEQIPLLRRLWTERPVTERGRFDTLTAVGMAPSPIQQPIPIWVGGNGPAGFRRAGRLGDGWFPMMQPGPDLEAASAHVIHAAHQAGRDPTTLGMLGTIPYSIDVDATARAHDSWSENQSFPRRHQHHGHRLEQY